MELIRYEYDLDMATSCLNCEVNLSEGSMVAKERYYSEHYKRWFTDYYCLTCYKTVEDCNGTD